MINLLMTLLIGGIASAETGALLCRDKTGHNLEVKIEDLAITRARIWGALEYEAQGPEPFRKWGDHSAQYEFLVDDSYDTNLFFDLILENGEIVARELYMSGNDSDNYEGVLIGSGDDAFICTEQ